MSALGAFVSPTVRSALRRARGRGAGAKDALAMVSEGTYQVRFRRAQIRDDTYFVPEYALDRMAARAILAGKLHEPHTHVVVQRLLQYRPGSLVHAGSFFGDMLPSFSRACPATVYAFEPVLENFVLAKLCVEQNQLENVVLLNSGLSAAIAPAKVDTGTAEGVHRGGWSELANTGQRTALLTVDALDIPDLTLLQLDVEGHELNVLRGAEKTIERTSPIILIEDASGNCGRFLQERGYSHAGSIPGLSAWTTSGDAEATRAALKEI